MWPQSLWGNFGSTLLIKNAANLHILRFITILVLLLITVNNCLSQYPEIEFNLKEKSSKLNFCQSFALHKKADTNTYPTLLSIGAGAHTYKFINQYYFEANILPYIGQDFYIQTGFIVYRIRYYDYDESTTDLFYLNLYFIHRWDIKRKIFIYGGGGFSFWPLGFLPNIILKGDYKLTKSIYIGIEIKKALLFGKNASKYFKYPAISFNFSIKL